MTDYDEASYEGTTYDEGYGYDEAGYDEGYGGDGYDANGNGYDENGVAAGYAEDGYGDGYDEAQGVGVRGGTDVVSYEEGAMVAYDEEAQEEGGDGGGGDGSYAEEYDETQGYHEGYGGAEDGHGEEGGEGAEEYDENAGFEMVEEQGEYDEEDEEYYGEEETEGYGDEGGDDPGEEAGGNGQGAADGEEQPYDPDREEGGPWVDVVDTALPAGWVQAWDDSMQAYYYLHDESGEASWVRPEALEEGGEAEGGGGGGGGGGSSAGGGSRRPQHESRRARRRRMRDAHNAGESVPAWGESGTFAFDRVTRTWVPNCGVTATSGSMFATLRPRVTPVVVRKLAEADVARLNEEGEEEEAGGGGAGGGLTPAEARLATKQSVAQAQQEQRRLHYMARHLAVQAKSRVVLSRRAGPFEAAIPADPRGRNQALLPAARRAQVRGLIEKDLEAAKAALETVQSLQEARQEEARRRGAARQARARKLFGAKESGAKGKGRAEPPPPPPPPPEGDGQGAGVGGEAQAAAWGATWWPTGPLGGVHPPAVRSVADFDALGDRALAAAWSRRRPPPRDTDEANAARRFVFGVPAADPKAKEAPAPPEPKGRQKFGHEMDHFALLTLHFHCGGEGWHKRGGWDDTLHGARTPGSHKGWHGVHTAGGTEQRRGSRGAGEAGVRVTNLVLPNNNLAGPLVSELRWLNELKAMSLRRNHLSGRIPHQWSTLTALTNLDLSENLLSGPLPAKLFEGIRRTRQLAHQAGTGLRSLQLGRNRLSGPLPPDLATLTALTTLNLERNRLSQAIPEALGECAALRTLRLSGNALTGPLPAALTNLEQLLVLEAADNELEGELPALPTSLTKVHLQHNRFTRDLPESFFALSQVVEVNLQGNYLSGALSDSAAGLKRLRTLLLDGNRHSAADRAVTKDCLAVYLPELIRLQGFRI